MEFTGRINKVYPIQTGVSAKTGKEWSKLDFIFEYYERETDRYSDKVKLSLFNDKIREYNIREGEKVLIGFGHSVRESQDGKTAYNEPMLYKFERPKHQEAEISFPESDTNNTDDSNDPF